MFDSVDVGEIPAHANAVAGYTSGLFTTFPTLEREFPHAYRLSIAVSSRHDADCLDIEAHDAEPGDAPGWYVRQRARGLLKPVLYASLSVVPSVEVAMRNAGIARHQYKVWSAHYTGHPHVCGEVCGLKNPADATQWTDHALGRNLDESLCEAGFFAPPADPLASLLRGERRDVELYDRLVARHRRLHPVAVRRVRRRLLRLRKEVWRAADADIRRGKSPGEAWRFRNRGARYAILQSRTRGLG